MNVSLIVAVDELNGIGVGGRLPWHLKSDLKRFKSVTMGHHIIMGRSTYESIGRLLPGRVMIVITRQAEYKAPGCLVVHSMDDALDVARNRGETEAFIIGGAQIFVQSLHLADRLYLTKVHAHANCDVFFPKIEPQNWREIERQEVPADPENDFASTFILLERASSG